MSLQAILVWYKKNSNANKFFGLKKEFMRQRNLLKKKTNLCSIQTILSFKCHGKITKLFLVHT